MLQFYLFFKSVQTSEKLNEKKPKLQTTTHTLTLAGLS